MKWVKVAIGAVIAIISIGIIATSVYDMTQERTKELFSFEVINEVDLTVGTYDNFVSIFGYNTNQLPISFLHNGILYNGYITYVAGDDWHQLNFNANEYIFIADYAWLQEDPQQIIVAEGDVFQVIQTTPPQLTGITATLILLTPLIFAGGVLAYLLNKQEL